MVDSPTLHGTVVAIGGLGVLIVGPSGGGKSDLALRLIDRGAVLVADDRVHVAADGGRLVAHAPARIAGYLEVRGLGIVPQPHLPSAPLALAVALVPPDAVPRLPEPACWERGGLKLPLISLNAFEVSAPVKIEWALRHPDWITSDGPTYRPDDRDAGTD